MKTYELNSVRLSLIILIISASLISFQIYLVNLLSITQWYHFAYMVIAIALLGFGTSGTVISIFRDNLLSRFNILVPILIVTTSFLISFSVTLSQTDFFYLDTYKVFIDLSYLIKLFGFYLLFFLPFFCGALLIGLIFVKNVDRIGMLYFSNMSGSGLGAIIYILLAWSLPPDRIPLVIAILTLTFSLFTIPVFSNLRFSIKFLIIIFAILLFKFTGPSLKMSEYKSLTKTLNLPKSEIIDTENSVYGQIHLVSSPYLRYSPGLSVIYSDKIPTSNSAFLNGDWLGPLQGKDSYKQKSFSSSTEYLPYVIGKRNRILFLDSRTGNEIKLALNQSPKTIVAVEPNKAITEMLQYKYPELIDSIYSDRKVILKNISSRTYLLSTEDKFDLIQLPIIDAFGGTSGLNALKEDYLLTKESFQDMISMLTYSGVISVSTWIDYPYKNSLKIFATISEVLSSKGSTNSQKYIAAIKNWNTLTVLIKKEPFNQMEIKRIREFCKKNNFDPIVLSDVNPKERNYYNKLQDSLFFSYLDAIIQSPFSREKLYSTYPFNIKPATDNKPYFFQFLQFNSLSMIANTFGTSQIPFFEIGYILLYVTFIQTAIISFILIILPLIIWYLNSIKRLRDTVQGKFEKIQAFLYFSGIGLGYMYFEIVYIQKFNLYFGNIIYSSAIVIAVMLIASGLGSLYTQRIPPIRKNIILIFFVIILLVSATLIYLDPLIELTIKLSIIIKIFMSAAILLPVSFFMGMPFPLGLKYIANYSEQLVPWAWGINGLFSVLGVVLATIISVEIGFKGLIIFTSISYLVALLSQLYKYRNATILSGKTINI